MLDEDDLLKKLLTGKDDPTVPSTSQEKCKEVNKAEPPQKKFQKNRIKQEINNKIRREISVVSIILVWYSKASLIGEYVFKD